MCNPRLRKVASQNALPTHNKPDIILTETTPPQVEDGDDYVRSLVSVSDPMQFPDELPQDETMGTNTRDLSFSDYHPGLPSPSIQNNGDDTNTQENGPKPKVSGQYNTGATIMAFQGEWPNSLNFASNSTLGGSSQAWLQQDDMRAYTKQAFHSSSPYQPPEYQTQTPSYYSTQEAQLNFDHRNMQNYLYNLGDQPMDLQEADRMDMSQPNSVYLEFEQHLQPEEAFLAQELGGWLYENDQGQISVVEEDPDFRNFAFEAERTGNGFGPDMWGDIPFFNEPVHAAPAPESKTLSEDHTYQPMHSVLAPVIPNQVTPMPRISGPASTLPTTTTPLLPRAPTTAELLKQMSGRIYRQFRIPRGLQRIETQAMVEHLAARQGVPIPPVLDDDISRYFKWHKDKPMNALQSFTTPMNVDIRLLGRIRITAAEIIAFFPNHLRWHDGIYRLIQNGWASREIAGYFNYVRQLSGEDAVSQDAIRGMNRNADMMITGKYRGQGKSRPRFKTTCFTAKTWIPQLKVTGPESRVIDYFLVDLADGLAHWPTGNGARLLTRAVQFAMQHNYRDVRLSQIHDFIQINRLGWPLLRPMARMGLTNGVNADRALRDELEPVISGDIQRVRTTKQS